MASDRYEDEEVRVALEAFYDDLTNLTDIETRTDIAAALDKLSVRDRNLLLRYAEGYTPWDAAARFAPRDRKHAFEDAFARLLRVLNGWDPTTGIQYLDATEAYARLMAAIERRVKGAPVCDTP